MPERPTAVPNKNDAVESPTPAPVAKVSDPRRIEYLAEMRSARSAGVRWRRISRWLGLAFFVFGAVLLAFVFWQALEGLRQFADPTYLSKRISSVPAKTGIEFAQAIILAFGSEFLRVIYLLLLGFVASAIAARGIQFFAASESVIDEAVVPEE